MRFIVAVLAALVASWAVKLIYPMIFKTPDAFAPPPGIEADSREHLREIAAKMKSELPYEISPDVTATDVFARAGELVFTFRLNKYDAKNIDGGKFREIVGPDLVKLSCRDNRFKALWKNHDITFSVQTLGKDGFSLGIVSVSRGDC